MDSPSFYLPLCFRKCVMTPGVQNQYYWLERMIEARIHKNDHQAIFNTSIREWKDIQATHKDLLHRLLKAGDHIIDVGCGAGYLLECIPPGVTYVGVDLNPHFIEWAKRKYEKIETATFEVADATDLSKFPDNRFNWAISRSVVGCCRLFAGEEIGNKIESETCRVAVKKLFLGYRPADEYTLIGE